MKRFLVQAGAAANLAKIYWKSHGGGVKGFAVLVRRAVYFLATTGPSRFVKRAALYRSIALDPDVNSDSPQLYSDSPQIYSIVQEIQPHAEATDIIVCVHNALDDVRACLSSIVRHSYPPYRLILVDDGSDQPTRDYLRRFSRGQGARLLRNEEAQGYTLAANQGLRASSGNFVVLLNSDTLVTPHWLDRLIMCAQSDERIGMVGPLSNTASWQSVPEILIDGDWAANPLPSGITVEEMGCLVAAFSGRVYPRVGFLNGFCLVLRRALIDAIGLFDEATFGAGFGEENDYCLRAQAAGWSLCIADDAYVYHAQSRSYSHERRLSLASQADKLLVEKYGREIISAKLVSCQSGPVIEGLRARAQQMLERREWVEKGLRKWEGKRIVFLLPVTEPGGGANVVVNESRALQKMGVDVRFINRSKVRLLFERAYPGLGFAVDYIDEPNQIPELCRGVDAVVATLFATVRWLAPLTSNQGDGPVLGYYIQDFEPDFFTSGSREYNEAFASYTLLPSLVRMTKTEWNRQKVSQETGVDSVVLGPSCDVDLFRPRQPRRPRRLHRTARITAMVRPSTPRRAPQLTLRVLTNIRARYGDQVDITLFGVAPQDPAYQALIGAGEWDNAGVLYANDLALLFNDSDIFVDFSVSQAMGLTALEAMACGAAVIVPESGGARSFAVHEVSALLVDTGNVDACETALRRLIDDPELRRRLQQNALRDVTGCAPEFAAYRLMAALFPE